MVARPHGRASRKHQGRRSLAGLFHVRQNDREWDADGWVEAAIAQVREQDWSVVVIHDIEAGCLARLPELIQRLTDLGATFEQALPRTVILTEAGRTVSMSPDFIAD